MFGVSRFSHVEFIETSTTTFKHLYLKGWEASFETMPYPPSTGRFAVYTIEGFYESVTNVADQVKTSCTQEIFLQNVLEHIFKKV